MPYIKPEQREFLESLLATDVFPRDAGELNYTITRILLRYLKQKGESYQNFNEIMGVLNSVTQEFYRRWVAPYEDQKIAENGDVEF